jgi:hypothetical protein
MLPDIRAVIAALVAAVGLLMVSFALVATFRVAQESRSTTLQAASAERTRVPYALASPSNNGPQHAVMIIETPGPLLAPRPPALDPPIAVKVAPIAESAPDPVPVARVDVSPIAAILATSPEAGPVPDLPMGGPLVAEPPAPKPELPRVVALDPAERDLAKKAAEQKAAEKKAAAEKARKAQAARAKKKAAARRAAQARAAKQQANPFGGNQFGSNNAFGGTFTNRQ